MSIQKEADLFFSFVLNHRYSSCNWILISQHQKGTTAHCSFMVSRLTWGIQITHSHTPMRASFEALSSPIVSSLIKPVILLILTSISPHFFSGKAKASAISD